jgi:hypothetical protein
VEEGLHLPACGLAAVDGLTTPGGYVPV